MNTAPFPAFYQLTEAGAQYIAECERNENGHITTGCFQKLILLYLLMAADCYRPAAFKSWAAMKCSVGKRDLDLMNTRYYKVWKHHVDAAKATLLERRQFLEKAGEGVFKIPQARLPEVLEFLNGLVEAKQ